MFLQVNIGSVLLHPFIGTVRQCGAYAPESVLMFKFIAVIFPSLSAPDLKVMLNGRRVREKMNSSRRV